MDIRYELRMRMRTCTGIVTGTSNGNSMVWYGMVRYGMARYGTAWHGTVW